MEYLRLGHRIFWIFCWSYSEYLTLPHELCRMKKYLEMNTYTDIVFVYLMNVLWKNHHQVVQVILRQKGLGFLQNGLLVQIAELMIETVFVLKTIFVLFHDLIQNVFQPYWKINYKYIIPHDVWRIYEWKCILKYDMVTISC